MNRYLLARPRAREDHVRHPLPTPDSKPALQVSTKTANLLQSISPDTDWIRGSDCARLIRQSYNPKVYVCMQISLQQLSLSYALNLIMPFKCAIT
jgi:hypothetical protein